MLSFIPNYQTLGPRAGWKLQSRKSLPFPLNYDRAQCYYLGRNAIYHGARALGLGQGDEVLFPAYHSGTESAPLLHLGCELKFYNVDCQFDVDLDEIESLITPRTRAIYMIHFHGFCGPIEELRRLADRHGLPLIEDVALSMLAEVDGRPLGTWGDVSVFCTYKNLPVANGGILAINRDDIPLPAAPRHVPLYSELNLTSKNVLKYIDLHGGPVGRALRQMVKGASSRAVRRSGLKLTNPDALEFDPSKVDWTMGPLTRQLMRWLDYDSIVRRRRAHYEYLVAQLEGTGVVVTHPHLPAGAVPLFLPIVVEDKFGVVGRLRERQMEAIAVWGIHHPHLPRGQFPDTEYLVDHLIEIPVIQDLSRRHLDRIVGDLVELATWTGTEPPRTEGRQRASEAVLI